MGEDDEEGGGESEVIKVQDIDAYWLQRQVNQAFGEIDPQQAQKLAEEVLGTLEGEDERDIENRLVVLLEYDKFDLIKRLMKNRLRVVWCTRLARAKDDEERKQIESRMMEDDALAGIVDQIHATRTSAKKRQENLEKTIKDEARRLRKGVVEEDLMDEDVIEEPQKRGRKEEGSQEGWAKGQRQVLELDSLAFQQGAHLMANKRCELPAGSYRTQKKGYEEVHVPALKPKPFGEKEELVKIETMPEWAQPAFQGMKALNRVQSRVYDAALFSARNLLLCAPTGAGKTNVALLTMLHAIELHGRRGRTDGTVDTSAFKIVYVAPMKALVAEMVGNFSERLKPYGVNVRELTGDQSLTKGQIDDTQVRGAAFYFRKEPLVDIFIWFVSGWGGRNRVE